MYHSRSPSYINSPAVQLRQASRSPIEEVSRWSASKQTINGHESKSGAIEELQLWKSRCNDLESSLCQANTDLELAHFRAKKAQESVVKVDDLAKINEQLSAENEQLQKIASQRKAESEIWRQKYENKMSNLVTLKSGYDSESKRLIHENSRLRDELKQSEIDLIKAQEDAKSTANTESYQKSNAQIKAHSDNVQLYEEQLRKLRDIVAQREREIQKLTSQVSQARSDGSAEAVRLGEDREKLKLQVASIELQSSQELEKLKSKLDNQQNEHLDALKRLHDNELEVLVGEAQKLRNLLNVKTREIEALIDQNVGLKNNFEAESRDLRLEISNLRSRIAVNNEYADTEISTLQDQLNNQHAADIQGLRFHHENQIEAYQQEQKNLSLALEQRQKEIEDLQQEKQNVRDSLNNEIARLSVDIQIWQEKYANLEQIRSFEAREAQLKYDALNAQQKEFAAAQYSHIKSLEADIESLKKLLIAKSQEIDSTRAQHIEVREALQQDLKQALDEIEDWKKKFTHLQHVHDIQVSDSKLQLSIAETRAIETQKKLENQVQYLSQDVQKLRDTLITKEKEADTLFKHKELKDKEIFKLNNEIDSLTNHVTQLERLKGKELEELRNKLETNNNSLIESIQASHQNQVEILNGEINDLKRICEIKEAEAADLLDKYEKLESAIGEFKFNSEKLKEHQAQIQAIGSEIINNKSIYDSYQKSRHTRYPSSATKSPLS